MKKVCLALMLLLSACAPGPNQIDSAFQPLYDQFISDANAFGLHLNANQGLTIEFYTLEQPNALGEVIGECSSVGYGGGTIQIDPKFWFQYGNDTTGAQQTLLYHELGHCVLGENHTPDQESIMNASINYPINYFYNHWSDMVTKLMDNKGH